MSSDENKKVSVAGSIDIKTGWVSRIFGAIIIATAINSLDDNDSAKKDALLCTIPSIYAENTEHCKSLLSVSPSP